jgi:hypothetical protein
MVLLCFVSKGIITVIPYYENSYDTLGNKAQQCHNYENIYDTLGNKAQQCHIMRTVVIPLITTVLII